MSGNQINRLAEALREDHPAMDLVLTQEEALLVARATFAVVYREQDFLVPLDARTRDYATADMLDELVARGWHAIHPDIRAAWARLQEVPN